MKFQTIIAFGIALLSPVVDSIKCWSGSVSLDKSQSVIVQYTFANETMISCYRFRYQCNSGELTMKESACFGKTTQFGFMHYGAADSQGIEFMRSAKQVYQDLYLCSSPDYCNSPTDAVTSATTTTSAATPTSSPSQKASSSIDLMDSAKLGLLTVISLLLV